MTDVAETTKLTLSEFLLARIAEDEARPPDEHYMPFEREWEWCPAVRPDSHRERGDDDRRCDCNGPARRRRHLAECEAKRRIVNELIRLEDVIEREFGNEEAADPNRVAGLQHLASVYADHPEYREEWQP